MGSGRFTAGLQKFQEDPHWRDLILFYEYFHGDNGAGLGASHQTGWTGLVAPLLDFFGRLDAKALLESERGHVLARVISEQVGGTEKNCLGAVRNSFTNVVGRIAPAGQHCCPNCRSALRVAAIGSPPQQEEGWPKAGVVWSSDSVPFPVSCSSIRIEFSKLSGARPLQELGFCEALDGNPWKFWDCK